MGELRINGVIRMSSALPDPVPIQNLPRPTMAYYNHNGTTENYLVEVQTGNATGANASHQMNLSTGTGAGGTARYHTQSKVDLLEGGTSTVCINFFVTGLANGAGVDRITQIGFSNDFTNLTLEDFTGFAQLADNNWYAIRGMGTGSGYTSQLITTMQNGDLLGLIINNQKTIFMKAGVVLATLPALGTDLVGTGYSGAAVSATAATVSGARTLSVSYIGFETYQLSSGK